MHPQRTSTALRQLDDLGHHPALSRWPWAVVKLEPIGRVVLPASARQALGATPGHSVEVRAQGSRLAVVLRRDGPGAAVSVDGRGRLYLPVSLQRAAAVLVGTRSDARLVVVANVEVLDGIGDVLAGDRR
jgi:bifunctional DNA-binding transcriptional regulator/antitoxin component of YhaV-PrlF toxin-antitoxin module